MIKEETQHCEDCKFHEYERVARNDIRQETVKCIHDTPKGFFPRCAIDNDCPFFQPTANALEAKMKTNFTKTIPKK